MAADTFTKTTKEISEYVGRTYKNGGNLRHAIARMVKPALKMPDEPPVNPSATQEAIWKRQIDKYVKQGMMIEENLKTAYALIWGQCTDSMRAKLESSDGFVEVRRDQASEEHQGNHVQL